MRVRKCPFGIAGQYVGPWFVGSVDKASSSVFFSEGFQMESVAVFVARPTERASMAQGLFMVGQMESVAVMWERSVSAAGSWLSDFSDFYQKALEK